MQDYFRPHFNPAQLIYDALVREAEHRQGRTPDEWMEAERYAAWETAYEYAEQHDLRAPTMEDVARADHQACGHTDYAAQLAHGLAEIMTGK